MARGGRRPGAGRKPKQMPSINPEPTKRPGAPTAYHPEYAEQARKLYALGATDFEVAEFFEINVRTLYRWLAAIPEFSQAAKGGKDALDDRVERSLFHRAVGYSYKAVKIFNDKGKALIVEYDEHVPPDTGAAALWLKNRRKEVWRDKPDEAAPDAIVIVGGLPDPE